MPPSESDATILNRLSQESSPYLKQHEENPVDWWPWSTEAFEQARILDRPVFLSIGYSACHWCHVMAHESFEDPAIAALLNARFVSIKVDREERPDVDAIYMEAVQALTGQGGWPMTVFCAPDGRPFQGGTYFPNKNHHGLPSFKRVLLAVDQAWRENRETVLAEAEELSQAIRDRSAMPAPIAGLEGDFGPTSPSVARALLHNAVATLASAYDRDWGGFGSAPKFPQPALLDMLLRLKAAPLKGMEQDGEAALQMVLGTLGAMAAGGIRDHLGGGFARYSTDRKWLVPHFEKMAYDQAGLAMAYLHAWQLTGSALWLEVAEEILNYVDKELSDPSGGIHCAEDADSEGKEGVYYLWTLDQIREVLGDDKAAQAAQWWGATKRGNFEASNILHRPWPGEQRLPNTLVQARDALVDARRLRPRPGRDNKVLTEWNAMVVSTFAEAAMLTGNSHWEAIATRIGNFLWDNLRDSNGRWLRSWHGGKARHLAYASDYAWVIDAYVKLGEATGKAEWTNRAISTADDLLRLFWDEQDGGLYTYGSDAEGLVVRGKEVIDSATPSANSAAAMALGRLWALSGDDRYLKASEAILERLAPLMRRAPSAMGWALAATHAAALGAVEVVVVGERPELVAEAQRQFLPQAVLAWGEPFDSPLWASREPGAAYVCKNYTCGLPAKSVDELALQLKGQVPLEIQRDNDSHSKEL